MSFLSYTSSQRIRDIVLESMQCNISQVLLNIGWHPHTQGSANILIRCSGNCIISMNDNKFRASNEQSVRHS